MIVSQTKKILILGGSSYAGRHLFARLGPKRAIATYYTTPIENGIYFDSVSMNLSELIDQPNLISCAIILLGDTNPESCVLDIKRSNAINIESIKRIVDYLKKRQIKPIFISSEFVFDGKKGNYREEDAVNPILVYGKQKVEIEKYLQDTCQDYIIIRLAKVFGSEEADKTIFTSWLESIGKVDSIRCANDQIFSPIYIEDVIESIIRLIENDGNGVFHVSGPKPFVRIELLQMLLGFVRKYSKLNLKIIPCSINDFNLKERRPLNVSMIPDKLVKFTEIKLKDAESVCRGIVKNKFKK